MEIGLSPLQGQASFDESLRECERAEEAGFDSVWLGEHHNNPILHPAPLIGLAAIASRTSHIRLGTGVLLLPLYHPMMIAEEGAMVDMISGGRLILGIGAGYAPEEFSAFGYSSKSEAADWRKALRCCCDCGRKNISPIGENIITWKMPRSRPGQCSNRGRRFGLARGPKQRLSVLRDSAMPGSSDRRQA